MVTWRHTSPLYKHWYRLITVEPPLRSLKRGFVISRLFSIHYTVTGADNIFQYTEDFVISSFVISRFHCKKEKHPSHPSRQFWFLSKFAHSHPLESRIIPSLFNPPPPRQFSLAEVQFYPALVGSTCTWQFNSYPTTISGDRTKWFSINSLLFWKIGGVIIFFYCSGRGAGVHLPIIKSPVHHSIHSLLFFRKIVGRYGRPSWIGKAWRPLPLFMWNWHNNPFR